MTIIKRNFSSILPDNEIVYFQHFEALLEAVDELCKVEIIATNDSYKFRIAPSSAQYRDILLSRILEIHKIFQIRLDISKSIKTTGTIFFEIKL
jgi:hypothetical protein